MLEDTFLVKSREEKRALVLNRVLAGEWTAGEAAAALGLSERQVRRLKTTYEREGIRGLVHGNRGRQSSRAIPVATRSQVVALARGPYVGCNDQHLTELLAEREGLEFSRETVRRWLRAAGLRSPRRRRAPKHRSRRDRMPAEGMLLQIDGSRHDWLGGRGPYLTLIAGIDDATGKVPFAVFRPQEDAHGYFLLLQEVVLRCGRPLAVYRDRHGIFERSTRGRLTRAEQLYGEPEVTQFGRLLVELDITSIPAQSPQAKGRIERVWGTFQDRLVVELRLADVTRIEAANQVLVDFLPRFNARFSVPASSQQTAYRPLTSDQLPERVFCFKYPRVVAADNTVQFGHERIQILPSSTRISYAQTHVEVHERLDGSLAIYYQGAQLATRPAPPEAPVLRARRGPRVQPVPWTKVADQVRAATADPSFFDGARPTHNHPWKRSMVVERTKSPST
jgi:transposase